MMMVMGTLTSLLDLTTILTTALLGLVIYIFVWSTSVRYLSRKNVPPYPTRPWPFVGHLFMLTKQPLDQLQKWRESTGDLFSLDFAGHHMVVVNGIESLKDVLVKKADKLSRPETFLMRLTREHGIGIINSYGSNWKEQRTVALAILRAFGMGKNVLAEKIDEEVEVFIKELFKLKGEPSDVKLLAHTSVANVLNSIVLGKRFEHTDPNFRHLLRVLNALMSRIASTNVLNHFRFLRYIPGDPFESNVIINLFDQINAVLQTYISKERKILEGTNVDTSEDKNANSNSTATENNNSDILSEEINSEDTTRTENFISEYFKEKLAREARGEKTRLDERNLSAIITNLFGAGSETTGNTIMFFILHMVRTPEVQERIYGEIEEIVGTQRRPSIRDKPRLNYLNAAIMETLRLSAVAPIGMQRLVEEDLEVKGYTIPAGTIIMPNFSSSLEDEKTWGDPENFRPSRFLADDGSLLQPEGFIPFSLGKRVCLGESLARMELFLFLSALVQNFKMAPASDQLPETAGVFGITISPKPFKVCMIERQRDV